MKLSTLKKKYPKAFKKCFGIIYVDGDIREEWKEITGFMDGRGIIIIIKLDTLSDKFYYEIYDKKENWEAEILELGNDETKRSIAETLAIETSFKILENRINEREKKWNYRA